MANTFDTRKSCVPFNQSSTLVAVIELSKDNWLAGGIVPGLERNPVKKLNAKERKEELLGLLLHWRDQAIKLGRESQRIAVAFESGWRAG
jgi:transposase